jgi:two-component system cell cycle sensor histidine kinase/response regulator CckA
MANAEGWTFWYNARWYDYTGTTPQQMERWGWQSVHDPEVLPKVLERWKASLATGEPFEMVFPLRGGDGVFRPFLTRVRPLRDSDGQVSRWLGTNTDISEQRKQEEMLAASERLYRAIGESIDYGVWVCDRDGRNTYASESFLKLVGMTQEQCSDFGWGEALHPDDAERTIAAWQDCVRSEGRWEMEHRFRGMDGKWHPILARGVPVRDEAGRITCWVGLNLDISTLKHAEEEMRRSNAVLEAFFEASPGILNIDDEELRYVKTDRLTAAYFGLTREEITGRSLLELAPEFLREYGPMLREVIETGRPRLNMEVRTPLSRRGGEVAHWLASYFPLPLPGGKRGIGVVGMEITEMKRAEERLQQGQKLESIGRFAGGLAHDYNNLMSIIVLHADSALEDLSRGEPAVDSVTAIRDAAAKAVALGQQLMAFSSKQVLQPEVLDLNSVTEDAKKLVGRLIGEDVRVAFQPGPALALVRADRGQILQIIMNLAVNSRDAMPQGGALMIETANVELNESDVRSYPGVSPGAFAMLVFRDSGHGMDQATQARIFEPFFTTKGAGRGTGLGLSVVYGIVKQSGGFITVWSEPGLGSEFRIHLPAVTDLPKHVVYGERGPAARGSEAILLAEDEPELRLKICDVLKDAGYRVLVGLDGHHALRLAMEDTRQIQLLLTDVVMPEVSGARLAERLRAIRPDMKTLYMSGYPDISDGSDVLPSHFIQKPFSKDELLRRVREILDCNTQE